MGYTAIPDFNTLPMPGISDWNTYLKYNFEYLFGGRPKSVIARNNAANYTTTSTIFVDVDATNLIVTATINSGLVQIAGNLTFSIPQAVQVWWDISLDGTRIGGTDGVGTLYGNTTSGIVTIVTVPILIYRSGLSVGSHTFKLQWKQSGGTASLYSGAAGAGQNILTYFTVTEVG